MSQISSQIYDPNLVSIPFAKFSHNTSPYGTRNFIWNHIGQRDDLDLIIRNNRMIDEQGNYATRVMLKITTGVDVLETQDLGELVNFIRDFDPSSGAEHPVQVVIRCPFMAMKYPKTVNAVRRIQLKFRNEEDFKKAINILKDLGFPITDSGPNAASASRPSISPALSTFSSIPTPKPLVSSLPPSSTRPCLATGGTLPTISEFKIPFRPDTRNSETTRPSSTQSFSALFDRPVSTSTTFSAPTPPSSVSAISPLYGIRNHASLLYPIQHEGGSEVPSSYDAVRSTTPSSLSQSRLYQLHDQHQPQETSDKAQHPNNLLISSPFFSTRPSEEPLNITPIDVDRLPDASGQSLGLLHCARPAPNQLEPTNKSNDLLPPKRELPFPKRQDGDRGRPSPKSDLPPLPIPTPVRKADSRKNNTVPENKSKDASTPTPKPAKKRVAQRKPAVKKLPEAKLPTEQRHDMSAVINSSADIEACGLEDEVSPLAAKSSAARPSSATSGLQSKATATKKRPPPARPSSTKKPKMVDQCTQTQTLPDHDHTTALATMSCNENLAPIPTEESPPPPPQSYLDLLDTFMRRQRPGPAPIELWERPGYTEGDEEQRQAIINDFICENLENPDFLQLCEDTEKAWRRIGLGI